MDERKADATASQGQVPPPDPGVTVPVPFDAAATAAVPAPSPLRPATFPYHPGDVILPGYRLTKRLGSGGFGEVWRATAPGGMGVAIKILANLGRKEGGREYRALQTIKNIRHAHIVPLFGVWLKAKDGRVLSEEELADAEKRILAVGPARDGGSQDDQDEATSASLESLELIVAMGLGDQTLFDRLRAAKRAGATALTPAELMPWMQQAALALDHFNSGAHRSDDTLKSVQHCDIKPQNILLVGDAVQVCDFGLARAQGEVRATSNTMASLAYAAPEMVSPPYDPSPTTDQYSLAMTYVELRTGKLPYSELNPLTIVRSKLDGRIDLDDLPAAEARVLQRALAVDPAKRWQNCAEFIRALRASARQAGLTTSGDLAASLPVEPAAPTDMAATVGQVAATVARGPASGTVATAETGPRSAARRRAVLAAGAFGAVAAALAGGYAVLRPPSVERPAATANAGSTAPAQDAVPSQTASQTPSPRERAVALQRRGAFAAAGEAFATTYADDPDELAAVLWDLQTQAADARRIDDCIPLLERLEKLYAASPAPRVKGISRWDVVNALAWYTATRPNADAVDGRAAVVLAREGLSLAGDDPGTRGAALDTLAAATARAGDFAEAVRRIDEAIQLSQDPAQRADYQRHRARYAENAAWSEP
jgi:serine/threonine protein kinase